uniref:Glycosyltransferase n=1 Tax=viral metagenome TaxID=1070528 RepID=A0A6C0H1R1_9ZZZZ
MTDNSIVDNSMTDNFPKNIWFYWDYSRDMPDVFTNNINKIKSEYNDFNVEIINDEKINSISEINIIFPELLNLYNKINIYAAKADIARLIFLYFYGGLYLDTHINHDTNNINELFEKYKNYDFVIAKNDRCFNCSSLISKKKNNILNLAINNIINNLKKQYDLENINGYIKYDILMLTGSSIFFSILSLFLVKISDDCDNITNMLHFKKYNTAVYDFTKYFKYYQIGFHFNHGNDKHWHELQKTQKLFK